MAALSADVRRPTRARADVRFLDLAIKTSAVVYNGSIINYVVSTKRVVVATAATARTCAGVHEGGTLTGVAGGTVRAKIAYNHEVLFTLGTGLTSAYLGANAAVKNDNEVTSCSAAGTALVQVRVGQMMEIDPSAAGSVWVWIRSFSADDV